jgi:hypothetical protein
MDSVVSHADKYRCEMEHYLNLMFYVLLPFPYFTDDKRQWSYTSSASEIDN